MKNLQRIESLNNFLPQANEVKTWLANLKKLAELKEKNNPLIGNRIYSLGHTYLFAKKAIEAKWDVNSQETISGNTPLHFALEWYDKLSKYRILPTIKLLIDNGANLNIKNSNGKTFIDIAKEKGLWLNTDFDPKLKKFF